MELILEHRPAGIAICGTGVTMTDMAFACGLTATAFTEEIGGEAYSFLLIYDAPYERYAVSTYLPIPLWEAYEAEILAIFETIAVGDAA